MLNFGKNLNNWLPKEQLDLFKNKGKCVEVDTGQSRQSVYRLVVKNLAEYTDEKFAEKPLTERSEILLGLRPYPRKQLV